MNRYEKYKPSGVEWIGNIPIHWEIKKLKYLSRLRDEAREKTDFLVAVENIESETGKILENSETNYVGVVSAFKKGDTIFNKLRPYLHKVYFAERDGGSVGELLTLFSQGEFIPKFLYYELFSRLFINVIDGSTQGTKMPRASWNDFISHQMIPYPIQKDEQAAIIDYLDKKTTQLSKLISNKQRLIELLKEERTAVINEAVSGKGKNWERKKLKYIIKDFESGVSVNSADEPVSFETEIGILKTSCVYNYVFEPSKNKRVLTEEVVRVSCPVKSNSLIISRMNTPDLVGASGFVDRDYPNLFLPDRLWQTILHKHVHLSVKYLGYVFISNFFRQEMTSKATGTSSSMKNLSKDDVLEITVPIPCYDDQISILKLIEAETQKIDTTNSKIEKEINLMQEYRTALISEVVTGKIKIG